MLTNPSISVTPILNTITKRMASLFKANKVNYIYNLSTANMSSDTSVKVLF